jgi:hypothetical protein
LDELFESSPLPHSPSQLIERLEEHPSERSAADGRDMVEGMDMAGTEMADDHHLKQEELPGRRMAEDHHLKRGELPGRRMAEGRNMAEGMEMAEGRDEMERAPGVGRMELSPSGDGGENNLTPPRKHWPKDWQKDWPAVCRC